MADDFLSQDEVDALLQDVEDNVLADDDSEHNASLVASAGFPQAGHAEVPVAKSSFRSANLDAIARWDLPGLALINERFAQRFSTGMREILGTSVKAVAAPVKLCAYREFTSTLKSHGSMNVVRLAPLQGSALMVVDPDLVFVLIDHLFGGTGQVQENPDDRRITDTEQRVLKRVLSEFFLSYATSWNPVCLIELEVLRSETNPRFVSIAAEDDIVALSSISIEFGSFRGSIHICLPAAMLEPMRARLSGNLFSEAPMVDQRWPGWMSQQLQTAEIELVARLSEIDVTLGDLMRMQPGDFIPLEMPETISVFVEEYAVMGCSYGISNHQYALRIEQMAAPPTGPHLLTHSASIS